MWIEHNSPPQAGEFRFFDWKPELEALIPGYPQPLPIVRAMNGEFEEVAPVARAAYTSKSPSLRKATKGMKCPVCGDPMVIENDYYVCTPCHTESQLRSVFHSGMHAMQTSRALASTEERDTEARMRSVLDSGVPATDLPSAWMQASRALPSTEARGSTEAAPENSAWNELERLKGKQDQHRKAVSGDPMDEFYEERDTAAGRPSGGSASDRDPGHGRPSGGSASDRDHGRERPSHTDASDQQPRWQVAADWGWHDYEPEDQSVLTNSWYSHINEITLRDKKKTLYVNLDRMTQTNAKTNTVRAIRWDVEPTETFAPTFVEGRPSAGRGQAVIQPAWKKQRGYDAPPERAPTIPPWRRIPDEPHVPSSDDDEESDTEAARITLDEDPAFPQSSGGLAPKRAAGPQQPMGPPPVPSSRRAGAKRRGQPRYRPGQAERAALRGITGASVAHGADAVRMWCYVETDNYTFFLDVLSVIGLCTVIVLLLALLWYCSMGRRRTIVQVPDTTPLIPPRPSTRASEPTRAHNVTVRTYPPQVFV